MDTIPAKGKKAPAKVVPVKAKNIAQEEDEEEDEDEEDDEDEDEEDDDDEEEDEEEEEGIRLGSKGF
jgi:hypothetical protein